MLNEFVLQKRRAAKCKDSKSEASTKSDHSSSSTISAASRSHRGNCSRSSGDGSVTDLLIRSPKARTIIITLSHFVIVITGDIHVM